MSRSVRRQVARGPMIGGGMQNSGRLKGVRPALAALLFTFTLATAAPASATHDTVSDIEGAGAGSLALEVTNSVDRQVNQRDDDGNGYPDYVCVTLNRQQSPTPLDPIDRDYAGTYTVRWASGTQQAYVANGFTYNLDVGTVHENPTGSYKTDTCGQSRDPTAPRAEREPGWASPVTGTMQTDANTGGVPDVSCTYTSGTYRRIASAVLLRLEGTCSFMGHNSVPVTEEHTGVAFGGQPYTYGGQEADIQNCVVNQMRVPACDYNSFPVPLMSLYWADTFRST